MLRVRDGHGWLLVIKAVALAALLSCAALPAAASAAPSCDPLALADVHGGASVTAPAGLRRPRRHRAQLRSFPAAGHGQAQSTAPAS